MEMGGHGRYNAGRGFSLGNIAGDPFWLGSIGIGIVSECARTLWIGTNMGQAGWMIAFVASIIADINSTFPNYSWWSLAYMLVCIIGVIYAVGADVIYTYRIALTGFLAAGLVFTTSAVNALIYFPEAAKEAAAAGFILLSIDCVCWTSPYRLSQCANFDPDHLDVLLWR